MKKNIGKIYKMMALFIALVGGIGSLVIIYLHTSSIVASTNYEYHKMVLFFRYLLITWLCIFVFCSLFYALGHIIDILQAINNNVSKLCDDKNFSYHKSQ